MSDETERHRQDNRSPALHFEMVRRKPAASLAGVVTDICGYREVWPGHFRIVEYASLTVPLVISFAEAFAIGLGRDPGDNDRFASFAADLYAGPVVIESFGGSCCIQVNFTPLGARLFFGLPMSELRDRMIGLDDALGFEGIALRERLGETRDWDTRFAIAEGFVTSRLAEANPLSSEVAWAYRTVIATGGRTRISALAREIGWSRKHLAAKF
ncbi:AraC family transcriptional regulator, partial [Mesorhizobium sp. USDA-HM6]